VADPFLSEIRMMSFNFPPKGWALCNGQLLTINQNQALFSLLGTTYGGDGRVNFALPDLRGRVPVHEGQGHTLGQRGGEESHTLNNSEMPAHGHFVQGTATAADRVAGTTPIGNVLAQAVTAANIAVNDYAPLNNTLVPMSPAAVANTGGSQPHENRQPYLTISFCIALVGVFPSRN
jgi:microcystin-dependent protein